MGLVGAGTAGWWGEYDTGEEDEKEGQGRWDVVGRQGVGGLWCWLMAVKVSGRATVP